MRKIIIVGILAVSAAALTGCAGNGDSPLSPSAVAGSSSALNPDGSNLKVTSPSGLAPSGDTTVDTLKPTLSFTNAAGRFATIGLAYELELYNDVGALVYTRVIGQGSNTTSHQIDSDLQYSTTYRWRARGRLGNDSGPWNTPMAAFRTLDRPVPVGPAPGALPFPIPAECGPAASSANRFPCVVAVAAQSAEWRRCASGIGIGCHRFARQVVYALSRSDADYKMIVAQRGGQACNCNACGPSDGTMFREDTTVYRGSTVYDMIGGAGGPSPSLGWSNVGPPRPGDRPDDAPLCVP